MLIQTSYFYQVRFFKPYQLGFSTAVWDPKWFHDFQPQNHTFIDKHGVLNGLRVPPLAPKCDSCIYCGQTSNELELAKNWKCEFLSAYEKQLDSLDIDKILKRLNEIALAAKEQLGFIEEPQIILLVHEAPTNPCSERWVIQNWLGQNGIESKEFNYALR